MLTDACSVAETCIQRARKLLSTMPESSGAARKLGGWLDEAERRLASASGLEASGTSGDLDQQLARMGKAVRSAHWAQVRAQQVVDAVEPPPTSE